MSDPCGPDTEFSPDQTMVTMGGGLPPPRRVEDGREHFLWITNGSRAGQRLRFGRAPMSLGRRSGCDVVLGEDIEMSGRHCEVAAKGLQGDAQVTDLGSTNGTFVDGRRVQGSARLANGATLRIGSTVLKHEYRLPAEIAQSQELDRDLEKASHYVASLLPPPIPSGAVRADWHFQPSAKLGGDAFGYHWLDERRFMAYLVDVSGHGAGAAMHSVSVMNVLRQRALPATDLADPGAVLAALNTMFQMAQHDGMYFSIWYGVYDTAERTLRYASGGHHPAYLLGAGGPAQPLRTRNLVMGAADPGQAFSAGQAAVASGARLYLFSDGVFEVTARDGRQCGLNDFLPLLDGPAAPDGGHARQLYQQVLGLARPGPLEDDFSMLVLSFD